MCYIGGRDSQSFHHPRAAQLQRRVSQGLFICRCAAELISRLRREISSALPGRENFSAALRENFFLLRKNSEARNPFGLRASFILAAIYSRGTCRPTTIDVLMFHFRVRNGTGWDHQAMTTRLLPYFVLRTLYFVLQLVWLSSALAGSVYLRLGGRLASAWLVLCVCCSSLTPLHLFQAEIACHRGGV